MNKVTSQKSTIVLMGLSLIGTLLFYERAFGQYQQAQQKFASKQYGQAAPLFYNAYTNAKNKADRLKAEFGLAESLRNLDLLYSASAYYSYIVRRGPGAKNPFFKNAIVTLGVINSTVSLGPSHVLALFKDSLPPASVPQAAKGFYHYYKGIEAYREQKYQKASQQFQLVPEGSEYSGWAEFHLGVIAGISGNPSRAIAKFEGVLRKSSNSSRDAGMYEVTLLNLARVHYEAKRFRKAIQYYAQIPRDSDNWLEAIWESSWAFFLTQKHNNTLGNIHTIHSPFFVNRFYPESYILQAITFLRVCLYDETKKSLIGFQTRYQGVFADIKSILRKYKRLPKQFFRLVYDYDEGVLKDFPNAWSILDKLSRTDNYKIANDTIRFADRELARLDSFRSVWSSSKLASDVESFLSQKKTTATNDAGRQLYAAAVGYYQYLSDLSDQTGLIQAEMIEGRLKDLRSKIRDSGPEEKVDFIGGLQELTLGQDLEYWPFEGEYWEDELGGYVFNLPSACGSQK